MKQSSILNKYCSFECSINKKINISEYYRLYSISDQINAAFEKLLKTNLAQTLTVSV